MVNSCDPRLQPTPDYDASGPGSGLPAQILGSSDSDLRPSSRLRLLHLAVVMAGIGLAVAVLSAGGVGTVWGKLTPQSSLRKDLAAASALPSDRDLDRQKPQKQAELLLERAVTRSDGASDRVEAQIESRVDAWRGKLEWDAQLGQLVLDQEQSPSDRGASDFGFRRRVRDAHADART